MNKIKYPYSRPDVNSTDINAVVKVLKSQYLTQGETVKIFENEIQNKFRRVCSLN